MKGQTKYMDMAKNVNLDKQVDGRSKSCRAAALINHIPFDVQLVTSLERGRGELEQKVSRETGRTACRVWESNVWTRKKNLLTREG